MRGGGLARLDPLTDTVSALFRDADQSVQAVACDCLLLFKNRALSHSPRSNIWRDLISGAGALHLHLLVVAIAIAIDRFVVGSRVFIRAFL